jgi:hypothetical protein
MVDAVAGPVWSCDVEQARWIGWRLAPFGSRMVTSVVPDGFEAYARVLHPAGDPFPGNRLVRWAAVAAWSGMPLDRNAQFHSVALPPARPEGEAPWRGQGPRKGSLYPPDAEILAGSLRTWTSTPGQCWFCLWDGYGWENLQPLTAAGEQPSAALPDPVPAEVRQGPRVHLPGRDYLLYRGPVEAVVATVGLGGDEQTANLWWPQDRAWCVASEIDLPWTYVGGPAGLIESLVADARIEGLPAGPHDSLTRVEDWVTRWAQQATTSLFAAGEATITTSRGTVHASLTRPAWYRKGILRTHSIGDNGITSSGGHTLRQRGEHELRREVQDYLKYAVIGLVGG